MFTTRVFPTGGIAFSRMDVRCLNPVAQPLIEILEKPWSSNLPCSVFSRGVGAVMRRLPPAFLGRL